MAMNAVAVAMLLCTLVDAEAGTTSIGTAIARGDMRVDSYMVTGNATLFDGTMVETGQASAALRLDKGGEIRLSNHARGTLYRDRLVLQQGSGEWTGSGSFPIELNGLLITPSGPNSRGVVSMSASNTADVVALSGELRVTNNHGLLLAGMLPGDDISFAAPQAGIPASVPGQGLVPMSLYGTLSKVDGRYYLTLPSPDLGVVYELKGANLDKLLGKQIRIKGTANLNDELAASGAMRVIAVSTFSEILPAAVLPVGAIVVGASIAAGAAAIGVGVFVATQSSTPASR
jgi:hypothetical protein